jgi:hypothetical protein
MRVGLPSTRTGQPGTAGPGRISRILFQVGSLEWGRHGRLRDGRLLGIRDDKPAHAVQRE